MGEEVHGIVPPARQLRFRFLVASVVLMQVACSSSTTVNVPRAEVLALSPDRPALVLNQQGNARPVDIEMIQPVTGDAPPLSPLRPGEEAARVEEIRREWGTRPNWAEAQVEVSYPAPGRVVTVSVGAVLGFAAGVGLGLALTPPDDCDAESDGDDCIEPDIMPVLASILVGGLVGTVAGGFGGYYGYGLLEPDYKWGGQRGE